MDVLSDVVAVMRTGEPRSARVEWHGAWGQRFPGAPGAGFQVVLRGSCWLLRDDAEPVRLDAGDVLLLSRGQGHGLADHPSTPLAEPACDPHSTPRRQTGAVGGADGPGGPEEPTTVTLCGAYQLDPSRAHPLLRDLPDVLHLPARPDRHPELRAAMGLLDSELAAPRPGSDAAVTALLDLLLLLVLRAWADERAPLADGRTGGWAAALADPAVSRALDAIHRSPERNWTVETLAGEAGLSRAAFARRFAALVGRPPLGYLTWWRLTTAARRLDGTDEPLNSIARQVGYGSEFAFAHAFKREFGLPPGRYRRAAVRR
ncbi:AraC family transcriptional regulator [Kitasatospora sp. NPDC057692]|uniref:AraC family transcriptional regulator n=1 Tax=Kitasatospora sp. NPDC057692 TaxID=3346215 RepID=UPI00369E6DB4